LLRKERPAPAAPQQACQPEVTDDFRDDLRPDRANREEGSGGGGHRPAELVDVAVEQGALGGESEVQLGLE
jgi:hypothetical protein